MNKNIIKPLVFMALSPLTVFAAGNAVVGTPTDPDNTSSGLLQSPNTYEFTAQSKGKHGALGDDLYNFYGTSSVAGQWWVGVNSGTPYDTFVPEDQQGDQPSLHVTEPLCAGDEFFVGIGGSVEIGGYTSELRMVDANTLFQPDGTSYGGVDVYFGLRNAFGTGNSNYDPLIPIVDRDPLIDDPRSYVSTEEGLDWQADNVAPPTGANNDPALANITDEFSWIHYKTDRSAGDTIIFTVGKDKSLDLTEWVAYFVMPDDGRDCITGTPYEDGVDQGAADGLVFSWTVHATDFIGETPNPDYDPEVEVFFTPEPSSALMLLSGAGLLLLRRQRKVA